MKNLIVPLMILLLCAQVSPQVFGQEKSKTDPKDAQIDTLTRKLDSISKDLAKYVAVYDTLKKKVIHYNFDPAKTAFLIDSLRLKPIDSTLISQNKAYSDTIAILKKENVAMKSAIALSSSDAEKAKFLMTQEEIDKAKIVATLKQYKELVDNKVITDAEFIVLKKKYLEKL